MKNILNIAVVVTAATIGLSASAKSLEAVKAERAVGAPEVTVKERIQAPAFMKGLVNEASSNVTAVLGTGPENAVARKTLIDGLSNKDADAEAAWALVNATDATVRANALKDLNKGISAKIVAKAYGPVALDHSQKTECLTADGFNQAFTEGMSNQEKQQYLADDQLAFQATGKHIVTQGECDGGLNTYDLPARQNMRKIFHVMATEQNFGRSALRRGYKVIMKTDDAKAQAAAYKFENVCRIAAPAGA